jgi:arsenate-mycothiol transferase
MVERPSVLFVCVRNGGKSQMAAALLRHLAGDRVEVRSAGTSPGADVNALSAQAVAEVGASMDGQVPTLLDPALLTWADIVVVLGAEAVVEPAPGMRASIRVWETDEPSARGIDGLERMRLVRDDIDARVHALYDELVPSFSTSPSLARSHRPVVRVFEPALCCNTGVCGPDVDQALVTFTADLDALVAAGADIARHNLAHDPAVFAATAPVAAFLKVAGSAGLPLTLVDGVTVATGAYLSRARLAQLAGLTDREDPNAPTTTAPRAGRVDLGLTASSGCCGPAQGSEPEAGCCCP